MEKYREYIGWGAIVLAALAFLPIPLPALPPMLSSSTLMLIPGVGAVLLTLYPMLLFAAGIGLVKGWHGGRQLFAAWSAIAIPAALAGFQYNYVFSIVDLVVIAGCILVLFWGDWRLR